MIENKTCQVCKDTNFEDLDYLRDHDYWYFKDFLEEGEKLGFKICRTCGFVTYNYRGTDRVNDSYDRERFSMSSNHIVTCNRKNEYHKKQLLINDEFLKIMDSKEPKNILDVGMAQGYFLKLLHDRWPQHKYYGTEFSTAMRQFAKHEYGIENVSVKIDKSIQYDLISFYHVLEHCENADEILMNCRKLLKPDGLLYLSIPTWFVDIEESSGAPVTSFENYLHINHTCVFSRQSFKNLLKVTGWEIIDYNDIQYGETVICKMVEPSTDIKKENWKSIVDIMEKQKEAIKLLSEDKFEEAYKVFPAYPDAYVHHCLSSASMKDINKQIEILEKGMGVCKDNIRIKDQFAKCLFQWDENTQTTYPYYGNNIKRSEKMFLEMSEQKPGGEAAFYYLGLINAKYKQDYAQAVKYLKKVVEVNPTKWGEMWNFICQFIREYDGGEKNDKD